ncbi:MAG: sulfite exporter TauE/SafE family protein [Planctomycetota bacterium]
MPPVEFVFWVSLIALVAGFIHSAIGFGFGIVAVALLPWVLDVRQSHVVISMASIPVLASAAWAYREGADVRSLVQALIGAAVLLPLGLYAFLVVSLDLLVRGTGLAVLAMVAMSFRNRRLAEEASTRGAGPAWVAGGLAGFLAGAVSIAGPPVAAFALQQRWEQARFKAFVNQFLLAVSVFKVVGLVIGGLVTTENLVGASALAPAAMLGIYLGSLGSRRLEGRWFQWLVAIALIGISLFFLVSGHRG